MNKKKLIILIPIIIALAVLVCVGLFVISGRKAAQIADKLDMGDRYLQELEYEKALAMYKEILAIDPKNVDAYLGIVDTYMAMGDYENALKYAEEGYEETQDQVFVGKIEECKKAIGTAGQDSQEPQDSQNATGGDAENKEEPPVATPEPDVLMEGTAELEITAAVPENIEVVHGYGGVLITYKDGMYGAMNYAGKEIVPNIYNNFYEVPNQEGYFALAQETQVNEYQSAKEVHVFNAMGQEEIVVNNVGTMCIHKDKLFFETSQWSYELEESLCSVQLYDLTNDKYLFSTGELVRFEGLSISISGDTYYYTDLPETYRLQLNGTDTATAVEVEALAHRINLSNFSEGYAWDTYTMYDYFNLVSEDGQEEINCVMLLSKYKPVKYYGNGLWKYGKGKLIVMQDYETGKYHLMDINNAFTEGTNHIANVDNVVIATYDYIGMSDSPYLLASDGDKWFYIDGTGQVVKDDYLDCSDFYDGYAMIIDTDGCAYIIDEQFNKVAGGYKADSVAILGGIFYVEKAGEVRCITRPTE